MAKRSVNTSKTSPRLLDAKEKALKALALRKEGWPYEQIAKEIGYASESGARNAINRLLEKKEFEAVGEFRKLKLLQLDGLYKEIATQLKDAKGKVNLWAVDRLQAIIDQQARLVGAYSPTQVEVFDWRKEFEDAGLDSEELYAQFLEAATRQAKPAGG